MENYINYNLFSAFYLFQKQNIVTIIYLTIEYIITAGLPAIVIFNIIAKNKENKLWLPFLQKILMTLIFFSIMNMIITYFYSLKEIYKAPLFTHFKIVEDSKLRILEAKYIILKFLNILFILYYYKLWNNNYTQQNKQIFIGIIASILFIITNYMNFIISNNKYIFDNMLFKLFLYDYSIIF